MPFDNNFQNKTRFSTGVLRLSQNWPVAYLLFR